ncbi:MAG TPA: alpha-hydroxy acid oxidase [Solirubrobacterales bacterium]|nr:alpha-hydroxy acid oxidase [Solirubrobacterales bacterium]
MRPRERARARLPRVAFDFVDGGAGDEVTLARNRSAFDDLALVPRVLAGLSEVSTEIELFGQRLPSPVLLAPAGGASSASGTLGSGGDGDAAAARGAEAAGAIGVRAWSPRLEPVAGTRGERRWSQLYLSRDRAQLAESVAAARRLGFSALVLTADVPVAGNRERDEANGLTVPLRLTPRIALDAIRRPRWLWHYLTSDTSGDGAPEKGVAGRLREVQSLAEAIREQFNPEQTWEDLRWLRDLWDGPLLVKGVLCAEDAELALEAGCDGVIVSNHGGRQLDGTPASIEALPEVVAAVDGRAEVLLDGGVRRGGDVVKALSLGAKACLVGRPWVFAVAVEGEAGVTRMLERLREEISRDLHLLGVGAVGELSPSYLRRRAGTEWQRIDEIGASE